MTLRPTILLTCLAVASALGVGCGGREADMSTDPTGPTIAVYRHSAWSAIEPKGVEAHGIRRNLAPGGSVTFEDLTVELVNMSAGNAEAFEPAAKNDRAIVTVTTPKDSSTLTVSEGQAFNYGGYHVAIVAIYAAESDLGSGQTVFEIATVESLPEEIAQSDEANGPQYRLRVPHTLDKLTLHHSATAHSAGDDLGEKLRRMQIWGERDRNWWDIPYHFIIDIDGSVYEARDYRYVGDTNTGYDPSGHFLVNCYGNYNEQVPNEAQVDAIVNLFAWAAAKYDIDPSAIYGHRDLAQTSCPGDNLQALIDDGTLEARVRGVLAEGAPAIVWLDRVN